VPLSTYAVAIAVMLVVFLYSVLKLVKWSLNAEEKELGGRYVEHVSELFRLSLLAVLLLALGPALGNWATNAFQYVITTLPL